MKKRVTVAPRRATAPQMDMQLFNPSLVGCDAPPGPNTRGKKHAPAAAPSYYYKFIEQEKK